MACYFLKKWVVHLLILLFFIFFISKINVYESYCIVFVYEEWCMYIICFISYTWTNVQVVCFTLDLIRQYAINFRKLICIGIINLFLFLFDVQVLLQKYHIYYKIEVKRTLPLWKFVKILIVYCCCLFDHSMLFSRWISSFFIHNIL